MTQETDVAGNVTKTAYSFGLLGGRRTAAMTVEDPLLRKTVTWTDVHDNVVAVDDVPVGLPVRRTAYDTDALGQLHSVVSPGGETIEHTYDLLGQRLSTSTPDGGLTEFTYSPAGNVVTEATPHTNALPSATPITNEYEFGHLVRTTYPDDTPTVELTWGGYGGEPAGDNGAGQIIGVDDAARHQVLGYDENGRLDFEESTMLGDHPNNGPWTTRYDQDWLGRLHTVTLPDGDGGADGETVTNGYDSGGRLNQVTGTKECLDLAVLVSAVDATQTSITVRENTTGAPALPFTIRIDGEEMQVTSRVPGAEPGVWIYTVVRGTNGTVEVPTNVAHSAGAKVRSSVAVTCAYSYLERREYDEFGVQSFQQVGNGHPDPTGCATPRPGAWRRSPVISRAPDRLLQNQIYDYDAVGNVKEASNDLPKDVPALFGGPSKQIYTYDTRYRLKHAEGVWDYEPSLQRKYVFDTTYDDVTGNVTSAVQRRPLVNLPCKGKACAGKLQDATSYSLSTMTYASDAAHQFDVLSGSIDFGNKTTSYRRQYTYDEDGNVAGVVQPETIREMSWDAANRMTSIVDHNANNTGRKVTTYKYDFNGELAIEKKEQGESFFVNPWVTVRNGTMSKHIWAGQDRLPSKFAQDDTFEEKVYYLHKDLQGSTNIATDRVGKVFQHHEYFPTGTGVDRRGEHGLPDAVPVRRRLHRRGPRPHQLRPAVVRARHAVVPERRPDPHPGSRRHRRLPGAERVLRLRAQQPAVLRRLLGRRSSRPCSGTRSPTIKATLKLETTTSSSIGTPSTADQQRFDGFFAKHQGRRGRMALYWLSRQKEGLARQEFAEKFGTKRMLEFEFEDGKLSAIKLGAGFGPRKKFDFSAPASSTPTTSPPTSQAKRRPARGRAALTSASKTNPTTSRRTRTPRAAQPSGGSGTEPASQGATIGGHRPPAPSTSTSSTSSGGVSAGARPTEPDIASPTTISRSSPGSRGRCRAASRAGGARTHDPRIMRTKPQHPCPQRLIPPGSLDLLSPDPPNQQVQQASL